MKSRWGIFAVFAMTSSVMCADEGELSKDEARELAYAGQLETDVCETNEWYEDGSCDEFCREYDPDCDEAVSGLEDETAAEAEEEEPLVEEEAGELDEDEVIPTGDAGAEDAGVGDGGIFDFDAGFDLDAGFEDDAGAIEDAGVLEDAGVEYTCATNADCGVGAFCELSNPTSADPTGFCTAVPELCTDVYAPVCGMDGLTYDNECFAHQSGINVVATTSCEEAQVDRPCGGPDDLPCTEGEYCDMGGAALPIDGEGCVEIGICKPSPERCPELPAPVCGCDGETYLNMCIAWQEGTDIAHHGSCEEGPIQP